MLRALAQMLLCLMLLNGVPAGAAELVIGTRFEPVLDPHAVWTDPNVSYYTQIYGGLTATDHESQVRPGLAESWSAVSDTEWRFTLRPGATFHDGSPVTAEDVVASFERVRTYPKATNPFTGAIAGFKDIKALDERTIAITTDKPHPLVPQRSSIIQVVPAKIARNATAEDFAAGRAVIGAGAYKLVSFQPGNRLILERNPSYWGPMPKWEKVTFRFISDDAARVAALLGKDVEMIDAVPPNLVERLRGEADVNVVTGPSARTIFLSMDSEREVTPFARDLTGKRLDKNPFRDKRVREALALSIDRKLLAERVMNGLAFPAAQLTPPGFGGYNDGLTVRPADPARAKQLLAEAGFPNGFEVTLHCTNDRYVNDAKICQALGQMLARIGIRTVVETMPGAVFFPKAGDHKGERFSLLMSSWADSSGEALVLGACMHSYDADKRLGSWNFGHYANPAADVLIEQASSELDRTKRFATLAQAMKLVMEDFAAIPLHYQSVVVATRKGLGYKTWMSENTVADSVATAGP